MGPKGGADLRLRSPQPYTISYLLRDHGYGASASRSMSVYFPAEDGPYFTDLEEAEG